MSNIRWCVTFDTGMLPSPNTFLLGILLQIEQMSATDNKKNQRNYVEQI